MPKNLAKTIVRFVSVVTLSLSLFRTAQISLSLYRAIRDGMNGITGALLLLFAVGASRHIWSLIIIGINNNLPPGQAAWHATNSLLQYISLERLRKELDGQ